jgi:hypothetical protein
MAEAFVYSWRNKITNRLYIGYHSGHVNDGYICSSKIVLKEYNENPDNFERYIIASGSKEKMAALETNILLAVDAAGSMDFYNQHNNNAGARGWNYTHSAKTKEKIRAKAIGRKLSRETRAKMSMARQGHKLSPESIEKTRAAHIGSKRSEESKAKMRLAWEKRKQRKLE